MVPTWGNMAPDLAGVAIFCTPIEGRRGRGENLCFRFGGREIECLLYDSHQKGKMMIMIMKTSGSQVDSPVAEGNRKEGGGRKMRDLHKDT